MRIWLLVALFTVTAVLLWRQHGEHPAALPDVAAGEQHARKAETPASRSPEPGPPRFPAAPADSPAVPSASPKADAGLSAMHAIQLSQPCLAGTARAARTGKVAIHRWEDEKGIVHFSDQAPAGSMHGHRLIEVGGLPSVIVRATGYDVNLPDFLSQRAVADAQAIEGVLRNSLGVAGESGLALDIEFIASAAAYARRVGDPLMAGTDGTYSSRDRTIHIRLQDNDESNFRILRHEIVHALVHERIGNLPTAINEGMASYFERVQVSGMGAQVALDETSETLRTAAVATDGRAELVDLLAREGADFYASGREQRYLRAFALVAVLMERPEGRRALGGLLAGQRENPCQPVRAERILERGYPGGLAGLASDWARWLRDPRRSVQAY